MEDENPDFSSHKFPSMSQILEELKELWTMVLPITAMNMLVFVRAVVSVLFLGRLGKLELAGGALSIGFTNITGYSVLAGLASGLEPVCSQAYGGKKWDLLSLSLQRMVFILLMASIPISLLWVNLENIMNFMGQDREITAMAGIYCFYSLPDLLTNTLLQPLRVYLRSQQVAKPMMFCSLIAVIFHVPLNFWLVRRGVAGVATASVVTNLNMVVLMAAYVLLWRKKEGGMKWVWGWEVVEEGWWELIKVAVPSCLGICLEWWWYEIVTVMAGYLENPTVAVAATGILIQTTSMMYTVPMALAGCVSARVGICYMIASSMGTQLGHTWNVTPQKYHRLITLALCLGPSILPNLLFIIWVGNELGAGKPYKAKLAAMVALGCAFVIGCINVTWTVILRKIWAGFFTKDDFVKALVASVMPIMGLCELGNCPQTTGCGILRGTARPVIGAHINLGSFYFVGTPVAVGLAFWFNIGFSGLWMGLLSAQAACAMSILYVVLARTDWEGEALRAEKLTQAKISSCNGLEPGLELKGKDMNDEKDEETKQFLVKGNGNKEEMC